jgi:hypothetical protein
MPLENFHDETKEFQIDFFDKIAINIVNFIEFSRYLFILNGNIPKHIFKSAFFKRKFFGYWIISFSVYA